MEPSCSLCFVCYCGSLSGAIEAFRTDDGGSRGKDEGERGGVRDKLYNISHPLAGVWGRQESLCHEPCEKPSIGAQGGVVTYPSMILEYSA